MGGRGSLANMLRRAFGARSFGGFWRHWNPIWGYALARYVFAPLRRLMPAWTALIATFVVSGLIHDAVIMALRREPALLFAPWFLFLALGVVIGDRFGLTFGGLPWLGRAAAIVAYAALALALSLAVTFRVGLWWPAA
ncbi:MAG: MBOAT family O-acyltransferase [Sphingomonas sp.]